MKNDEIIKDIDGRLSNLQQEFTNVETEITNLQTRREQIRGEFTALTNLKTNIINKDEKESKENEKDTNENREEEKSTEDKSTEEMTPEEAQKIMEIKKRKEIQDNTPDYLKQ